MSLSFVICLLTLGTFNLFAHCGLLLVLSSHFILDFISLMASLSLNLIQLIYRNHSLCSLFIYFINRHQRTFMHILASVVLAHF